MVCCDVNLREVRGIDLEAFHRALDRNYGVIGQRQKAAVGWLVTENSSFLEQKQPK